MVVDDKEKRFMSIDLCKSDSSCLCTIKVEDDRIIVEDLTHFKPTEETYLKLKKLISSGNIEFRSGNLDLIRAIKEHDKEHIKRFTESFSKNLQALVTVEESHKEGDVTVIDKVRWDSVSLVKENPDKNCTFEIVKSDEDV